MVFGSIIRHGIGSATAILKVVDAVLLKPLPYIHGERWVALFACSTLPFSGLSFADLLIYQERMRGFEVFGRFPVSGDFNLTSPASPGEHRGPVRILTLPAPRLAQRRSDRF